MFIPIMLLIVELFRSAIIHYYPDTALFDRGSILESFLISLWEITWVTAATWILCLIVFPKAGKALQDFYRKFEGFDDEYKENFAVKYWLVIFLSLVFLIGVRGNTNELYTRQKLKDTLQTQLLVREATGQNDGVEVEAYLRFVGRGKGDAWCAAFVSYNLNAIGITKPINPVSAWAPSFANPKYIVWSQGLVRSHKAKKPQAGDCFTLFYSHLKRVGHVGFIVDETANYFITIEGNTGLSGSREGAGVHKLKRSKAKVYAVSNYITPYLNNHAKNTRITIYNGSGIAPAAYLLSPKDYRITYYAYRTKSRQRSQQSGFHLVQGHNTYCAGGQFDNRRCDQRGYDFELATNSYRWAALKGGGINYKWEAKSTVLLQGIRNKGKATGKAFKDVSGRKPIQVCQHSKHKDRGGSVYSEMG